MSPVRRDEPGGDAVEVEEGTRVGNPFSGTERRGTGRIRHGRLLSAACPEHRENRPDASPGSGRVEQTRPLGFSPSSVGAVELPARPSCAMEEAGAGSGGGRSGRSGAA